MLASMSALKHSGGRHPRHAQPVRLVLPSPQGMISGRTYQSFEVAFLCRGKGLN